MWWRVEGVRVWRGRAVTVCTVRLVTTKCQCQAKRTARCGCVKRITPHSSIERTEYLFVYIRTAKMWFQTSVLYRDLAIYVCLFMYFQYRDSETLLYLLNTLVGYYESFCWSDVIVSKSYWF